MRKRRPEKKLPPRCPCDCRGSRPSKRGAETLPGYPRRISGKSYYECTYCGCLWLQPDTATVGYGSQIVRYSRGSLEPYEPSRHGKAEPDS